MTRRHCPSASRIGLLVALLLSSLPVGTAVSAGDTVYTVTIDPDQPETATVSVNLPAADAGERRLISRAGRMGIESQVRDITCNGQPLAEKPPGIWKLPPNCQEAAWRVDIKAVGPDGALASEQQSLFFNGTNPWWLLSSPSSILRVAPNGGGAKIHLSAGGTAQRKGRLPALEKGPAFFVLGKPPQRTITADGLRLTYVANDLEKIDPVLSPEDHIRGIAYFRDILKSATSRLSASGLMVIWLGVTGERGEVGGAAGHRAVLANYIRSSGDPDWRSFISPLLTVLHEQFHQMAPGTASLWVNESLAQYYALQAMRRLYPGRPEIKKIWKSVIDGTAPVDVGLIEAQRRIREDGDDSV